MSLAVRRGLIALAAVLIAEAVWIVTVPPFRGSDEIDHVYRAAGAATGQIHLSEGAAPDGRGALVWVPTDIVKAAQKQCTALIYVGHDNCHAVETSGGRSLVATAAFGYDPTYYLYVGAVAKPFHGAAADYAMRAATALLCALLIALGVGLMTLAGTGPWTNLGVVAAITPEVLFSGAIPAPNGPEMGIAFVLWAALLAAVRRDDDPRLQRRLLATAGLAMLPLAFVRLLGPLWIVLIVGAVVALAGPHRSIQIARRHARLVGVITVTTAIGVVWWAGWQVIAGHVSQVESNKDRMLWILAFNLPQYTMQMVGAFPWRDEPAPLGIYPLAFFVILLLLGAAWRRGATRHVRRAVLWIGIASLLVPVVLSLVFMPSDGAIWQGRYEIPFVIGILPLCGLVLDDAGFAPIERRRLIGLSGLFLVIVHLACIYHVEQLELHRVQSVTDPAWWHPPGVVLAALMLAACAAGSPLFRTEAEARVDERELSLT